MAKKLSAVAARVQEHWGWAGTLAKKVHEITPEFRLQACGLSLSNRKPLCANIYADGPITAQDSDAEDAGVTRAKKRRRLNHGSSGPELYECSKKSCKANPNCLNYLGQEQWEDEDVAQRLYFKANKLGADPNPGNARKENLPVGLKNLGATCYANAFLQIWFQNVPFRSAVYQCAPLVETDSSPDESPLFQLQTVFAGLQSSIQRYHDPTPLVSSLELPMDVQRDAQEFGKLFLDHLDKQFRTQTNEDLRQVVTSTFQGVNVNVIQCSRCHTRSEREELFDDIVVTLEKNCKLEDRLREYLKPESMNGDNQYHCSKCDSMEDAARHTELRRLPPMLHFSIARFVWDNSGERQKSKCGIKYPLAVDMAPFISPRPSEPVIYDLRGVLLHKGASAHHGHYESQAFDVSRKKWFNFNDGIVNELAEEEQQTTTPASKKRPNRVVQSDDDDEIQIVSALALADATGYRTSRDAYMLVYQRRMDGDSATTSSIKLPTPPPAARDRIEANDRLHQLKCEAWQVRRDALNKQFVTLRDAKQKIYKTWGISDESEESIIVSRTALEAWLHYGLFAASVPDGQRKHARASSEGTLASLTTSAGSSEDTAVDDGMDLDLEQRNERPEGRPIARGGSPLSLDDLEALADPIDNTDLVCWHGRLDPEKATEFKRMRLDIYKELVRTTRLRFEPVIFPSNVCTDCVEGLFYAKAYQMSHPKMVEEYDTLALEPDDDPSHQYWISKDWLKGKWIGDMAPHIFRGLMDFPTPDWRLKMPKMHLPTNGLDDPAPDSEPWCHHVRCTHDKLSTEEASRKRISSAAAIYLMSIFPEWQAMQCNEDRCTICADELKSTKTDQMAKKMVAENEKTHLKDLIIAEPHIGDGPKDFDAEYAIIPATFLRQWYAWAHKPLSRDCPRPGELDCAQFICSHEMLNVDPNARGDRNSDIVFITRDWFDKVVELHGGGPLLSARLRTQSRVDTDRDVCADCRKERLGNIENFAIEISILDKTAGIPNVEAYEVNLGSAEPYQPRQGGQQTIKRYTTRAKKAFLLSLHVGRFHLIKTIKQEIFQQTKVMLSLQRLFLRGVELDNQRTVGESGVVPGDVLELWQEESPEYEEICNKYIPRGDEGFGGSILGGTRQLAKSQAPFAASDPVPVPEELPTDILPPNSASPPVILESDPDPMEVDSTAITEATGAVACPQCTFDNHLELSHCEICNYELARPSII
ncbi:cysteine proteinase [Auriculariales sp. MPI-PUGE-AT-0066]|nr:cysteine proteinase [Auriculariales sp. MPI-PUGE-AT-0066]